MLTVTASKNLMRLAPRSRAEAILQRRLILVAEGDQTSQRVIAEQLSILGYVVDAAGNGREALRLWKSGDHVLLLTDLRMPELDGLELTLAIRAAEKHGAHMPIIALTSNAPDAEAERWRAVGMDGYLAKPASLETLAATVEKWVPDLHILCAVKPDPLPEDTVTLDIRVMQDLIGDEPDLTRELLQSFATRARITAQKLTEGIHTHRFRDVADAAHNLKSSAHMVGAIPLSRLCQSAEVAAQSMDLPALNALLPQFEAELRAVQRELASTLAA
ncbi:MAG: response regulator [Steroidobacteraceae bacterium]